MARRVLWPVVMELTQTAQTMQVIQPAPKALKVSARISDRGQKVWRWGDRLVIRGNAAGNRDKPGRLTLETDTKERIVVELRRGMSPNGTVAEITGSLPPTMKLDAEMIDENAVAIRLVQLLPAA